MSEKCLVQSTSFVNLEVDIRGGIEKFEEYDCLIKELSRPNLNEVTFKLNTPGGDCSIGFSLIDRILDLECPVNMVVTYPTHSMGAIMALCGDTLELKRHSYLMFHDYSSGQRGKGGETHLYSTNYRQIFKDRFTELCYPFLSKAEINSMFKGEDLYIQWNDSSLEDRIIRHFK